MKRPRAMETGLVGGLCLAALLVNGLRAGMVDFAEVDVPLRGLSALAWWSDPVWPATDFWLPLHRMLMAGWLALTPLPTDRAVIAFGVLWLGVLMLAMATISSRLHKRWWWAPPVALALGPLWWEQSMIPLAELPAAAFLVLTFGLLLPRHDARPQRLSEAAIACLTMIAAQMLRYELWIVTPFAWLLIEGSRRRFYAALALVAFPLIWMLGHLAAHGSPFYGVMAAQRWQQSQGYGLTDSLPMLGLRLRIVAAGLLTGPGLPWVLPAALGLVSWKTAGRPWKLAALAASVLLALSIAGIVAGTAMPRTRYLLPAAALLLLWLPQGAGRLSGLIGRLAGASPGKALLALLAVLFLTPPLHALVTPEAIGGRPSGSDRLAAAIAREPATLPVLMVEAPAMDAYGATLVLGRASLDRVRVLLKEPSPDAAPLLRAPRGLLFCPPDRKDALVELLGVTVEEVRQLPEGLLLRYSSNQR